jgi:putative endonuclease
MNVVNRESNLKLKKEMANSTFYQEKQFYIYIMTNQNNTVLYTGVTSELQARVFQHKTKSARSFTSRYNIDKLVYYEELSDAIVAIKREKQIKGGSRQKKLDLVNKRNPEWRDLYDDL